MTHRPEVVRGDLEDVPRVVECWRALAREQLEYGSHVLPDANAAVIREEVSHHAASGRLLVARDEGIVGFATFSMERGDYRKDATVGVVTALYVVGGRRGEGIGTALLEAAEAALADRGATTVTLETLADNEAARRFYRANGYGEHRVVYETSTGSDNHSKEGE